MSVVAYQSNATPSQEELVALYGAVGWSAYTKDPGRLVAAIASSLAVVTARQEGELVGLARVVGDGLTIVYLQDLLVLPSERRRGIGRELFQRAFAPFSDVRQKVLITDDEPEQRRFYEAVGFTEAGDLDQPIRTFIKFD